MKRTLLVFLSAGLFILVGTSSIKSPNRVTNSNGASVAGYSTSGCNSCHFSAGAGSIAISGIPNPAIAGQAYPVTITLNDAQGKRWGFVARASKGTFTSTNPNVAANASKNTVYHGSSAPVKTATSYVFDNITWTAPTTVGAVTVNFAGIAANNNGNDGSGDRAYKGTFSTTVAIPTSVKLAAFTAALSNDKVKLTWQTLSETDANRFEIERSLNGREFTYVGKVEAKGNTTSLSSYAFYDNLAQLNGKVYYRLKSVDKDGSFTYSDQTSVLIKTEKQLVLSVYPNPTKAGQNIALNITALKNQTLHYSLVNNLGKIVLSNAVSVNEGVNKLNIKSANLPAGVYHLTTLTENKQSEQVSIIIE